MEDKTALKSNHTFQRRHFGMVAPKRLFWVIWLFVAALAVPMPLVFWIKSPPPDQHVFILGISYYKAVFVFLLSAVLVVHTSLFFLGTRPVTILLSFVLSLFCCFPLIVGLRNNLTLPQAIMDIEFFESWPFFLKPAYILIEFLIPAGIVVYLFLQIKSIFSRKSHSYAFLGAAAYLAVAASLGFSALIQTEEPNIVTVLASKKAAPVEKDRASLFPEASPPVSSAGKEDVESFGPSAMPIHEVVDQVDEERAVSSAENVVASESSVPKKPAMMELEQKVQSLSDKMDRVIAELDQMKTLILDRPESLKEKSSKQENQENPDATVQQKGIAKPQPTASNELPADPMTMDGLQQEMRLVAEKIDRILNRLGQVEKPPLSNPKIPSEDQGMPEAKAAPDARSVQKPNEAREGGL